MSFIKNRGRLGNIIIIQLSASIIAEKHDLYIEYEENSIIKDIGIKLFVGKNKYDKNNLLTDNNYFDIFNSHTIDYNIYNDGKYFFQTKKNSDLIHSYLNSETKMNEIINNNNYNNRYNNNNDCFIHIRLGDVQKYNPGFDYYDSILNKLTVDTIYIATDTNNHNIIKLLKNKYNNIKLLDHDLSNIFKLGSTCKHVILSYGTFSAMIGYISYYSNVYYKKKESKYRWDFNTLNETFSKYNTKISQWTEV
tara:strand:+ start:1067 stop:1816 length:750 start_codon:yes stop_codon:yes gene_type:complete